MLFYNINYSKKRKNDYNTIFGYFYCKLNFFDFKFFRRRSLLLSYIFLPIILQDSIKLNNLFYVNYNNFKFSNNYFFLICIVKQSNRSAVSLLKHL
jgi:hypothetical protein